CVRGSLICSLSRSGIVASLPFFNLPTIFPGDSSCPLSHHFKDFIRVFSVTDYSRQVPVIPGFSYKEHSRFSFQKREFLPYLASCTMTLGRLCLQVGPWASEFVSLISVVVASLRKNQIY